ncbi:MAG: YihY/virulence factor BrkB family protein [Opitutaceae bacterium]|nr:YihY/virulence factor BrkB family protein [Opitutaceae bacterium]
MALPRWLKIVFTAGKGWKDDNAFKHSAAVSFYTLFSLAPITIIAVGIASLVFGKEAATRQFSDQMGQLVGPASAELIQNTMEAGDVEDEGWLATAIGVVLLLVGATTVFGQLQDSLNAIWSVTAKPSRSGWIVMLAQRLLSFAMVLVVGFLLLTSLVLTTAFTAAVSLAGGWIPAETTVLRGVDFVASLALITTLFALLFKVLPDVKIRWREVWFPAFLTAILFNIGRFLIALYLGHSTIVSTYGAAGSLVALLIWIYYSCTILFYGVEYIRAHRLEHGLIIEPKDTAVVVKKQIVEEPPGKNLSPHDKVEKKRKLNSA